MQTHLILNQPFDTGSSAFPLYVWGTDEPYRPPPTTHTPPFGNTETARGDMDGKQKPQV